MAGWAQVHIYRGGLHAQPQIGLDPWPRIARGAQTIFPSATRCDARPDPPALALCSGASSCIYADHTAALTFANVDLVNCTTGPFFSAPYTIIDSTVQMTGARQAPRMHVPAMPTANHHAAFNSPAPILLNASGGSIKKNKGLAAIVGIRVKDFNGSDAMVTFKKVSITLNVRRGLAAGGRRGG